MNKIWFYVFKFDKKNLWKVLKKLFKKRHFSMIDKVAIFLQQTKNCSFSQICRYIGQFCIKSKEIWIFSMSMALILFNIHEITSCTQLLFKTFVTQVDIFLQYFVRICENYNSFGNMSLCILVHQSKLIFINIGRVLITFPILNHFIFKIEE